jgi:hypothetical protein
LGPKQQISPPRKLPRYDFDEDLLLSYQDAGPWRSYQIYSWGDNLTELLDNCGISEVGQDGDSINCYGLKDCQIDPDYAIDAMLHICNIKKTSKVEKQINKFFD